MTARLVIGLSYGAGFALLAVGWTLLVGAAKLVNFAHGQLFMLGAYGTWLGVNGFDLPILAAAPFGVALAAAAGAVMQLFMLRVTKKQDLVALMLVTLGFSYFIEGAAAALFGEQPRLLRSGLTATSFSLGDGRVRIIDLMLVCSALLVFLVVWLGVHKTTFGVQLRAVAEDPALSEIYGIRANPIYVTVFALSGVGAGLAGALFAAQRTLLPSMGFQEMILTFAVVATGGVGAIWGNLAAALALGLFISFFGGFVSSAYALPAAFGLILLLLTLRPGGFGRVGEVA